MVICAIVGCKNHSTKSPTGRQHIGLTKRYFRFPADPNISLQWLALTARTKPLNLRNAYICSDHFCEDDYEQGLRYSMIGGKRPSLKKRVLPTLNLPNQTKIKNENEIPNFVVQNKNLFQENQEALIEVQIKQEMYEYEIEDTAFNLLEPSRIVDSKAKIELVNQENELQMLKCQFENLKNNLKDIEAKHNSLKNNMLKIFSINQLKKLENPTKKVKWSITDISQSILAYSEGPRAYRYNKKMGHPLPAVSTLRRYARKYLLYDLLHK